MIARLIFQARLLVRYQARPPSPSLRAESGRLSPNDTSNKTAAGREIGFFAIVGHGVDEGLMARTRRMAVEIFALPTDENLRVERPPQKVSWGYSRFMDFSLSYSIGFEVPPDLQEAFAFGPEGSAAGGTECRPHSAGLFSRPERPLNAQYEKYLQSSAVR